MVVGKRAVVRQQEALLKVGACDVREQEVSVRQWPDHRANRPGDLTWVEHCSRYLVEERREQVIVVAID